VLDVWVKIATIVGVAATLFSSWIALLSYRDARAARRQIPPPPPLPLRKFLAAVAAIAVLVLLAGVFTWFAFWYHYPPFDTDRSERWASIPWSVGCLVGAYRVYRWYQRERRDAIWPPPPPPPGTW
jgi:hypothetical protein